MAVRCRRGPHRSAAQPAPAPEVVTAEAVDPSDVAAATDVDTAHAVILETLTRATETGGELAVPELAAVSIAAAAAGRMIAACMAGYRIVPTSRYDRGCRRFTVGPR